MQDQKMSPKLDLTAAMNAASPTPAHGYLGMLYEQHMKMHLDVLRAGKVIQDLRAQNEALQKQVVDLQTKLADVQSDEVADLVETEKAH